LPELGVGSGIDPLEALKTYLKNQDALRDICPDMIAAAEMLLSAVQD
jgi:exonuclease SbcD